MTSPAVRNDIQIERVVSTAICEEIGDRLRIELTEESDPLPRHMAMLVEQMVQSDGASAALGDTSLGDTSLGDTSFGDNSETAASESGRFEVPAPRAADPIQEPQIEKRH
jgi:hypothetical protein